MNLSMAMAKPSASQLAVFFVNRLVPGKWFWGTCLPAPILPVRYGSPPTGAGKRLFGTSILSSEAINIPAVQLDIRLKRAPFERANQQQICEAIRKGRRARPMAWRRPASTPPSIVQRSMRATLMLSPPRHQGTRSPCTLK